MFDNGAYSNGYQSQHQRQIALSDFPVPDLRPKPRSSDPVIEAPMEVDQVEQPKERPRPSIKDVIKDMEVDELEEENGESMPPHSMASQFDLKLTRSSSKCLSRSLRRRSEVRSRSTLRRNPSSSRTESTSKFGPDHTRPVTSHTT